MTPKEVLAYAKEKGAKQIDLRFTDLPGLSQHVSYPISQLDEDAFEEGFGFDGSSIRGWAAINESDMLLVPDPATAYIDPFFEITTLCMIANVVDPITRQSYDRDPRYIARKAEAYLKNSGIADTAYFGAEAEFFIFDNVHFDTHAALQLLLHRRRGRAAGIRAALRTTSATGRATRKATSRCRRPTITRTCAPRWCDVMEQVRPGRSSATTTKSPPAARLRSTRSSTRC